MAPGFLFRGQDNGQAMNRMTRARSGRLRAILAAGVLAATASAWAEEPYNNVLFVRPSATAAALFSDRGQCGQEASSMGTAAAGYTNPEYGALSAMGSALDEDALHEGGLHKRMRRAMLVDCMKRRGWTQLDPAADEAKAVAKASPRHPQALDAWLKAHEPPPAPAAPKP